MQGFNASKQIRKIGISSQTIKLWENIKNQEHLQRKMDKR